MSYDKFVALDILQKAYSVAPKEDPAELFMSRNNTQNYLRQDDYLSTFRSLQIPQNKIEIPNRMIPGNSYGKRRGAGSCGNLCLYQIANSYNRN